MAITTFVFSRRPGISTKTRSAPCVAALAQGETEAEARSAAQSAARSVFFGEVDVATFSAWDLGTGLDLGDFGDALVVAGKAGHSSLAGVTRGGDRWEFKSVLTGTKTYLGRKVHKA